MGADARFKSLQALIDATPDLVSYLYNDTPGPHSRARAGLSPVPAEFSNWRDEQRAWRETAILFDAGHATPGEEVTILWGEPDGGSRKPRVELHQQTLVRATVAPAPYPSAVRQNMRASVGRTA